MHGKLINMDYAITQLNEEKEERGERRDTRRERRRRTEAIVFAETKIMRLSQCSNFAVFLLPFPSSYSFVIIQVTTFKFIENYNYAVVTMLKMRFFYCYCSK